MNRYDVWLKNTITGSDECITMESESADILVIAVQKILNSNYVITSIEIADDK